MNYFERFLDNHVLANLVFVLVCYFGVSAYNSMPRTENPEVNLNFVIITTMLPGASSIEVEKRVTDPIEDVINRKIKDIRFVSSTSREGISTISIRFNEIGDELFDERIADIRREVQNAYNDQLPDEATDPDILELTSSSGFPVATLALTSNTQDEKFRRYVKRLQKELEKLDGVDSADLAGYSDPELHIAFYPERLVGLGLSPSDLADTVRAYFSDISMGDVESDTEKWVVRLEGTSGSIDDIARFPVVSAQGVVELGTLADIYRTSSEKTSIVRYKDKPAVMISIAKRSKGNTLEILDQLVEYVESENSVINQLGYHLELTDDRSTSTRDAISVMESNALIGLFFVVVVTYLFLGGQIAFLTSIAIPFILGGTFIVLELYEVELSNLVLLGVVIALGMLVDDTVVVVEAMYYRLRQGMQPMQAALAGLQEIFAPVLTSVLTTMAVFLPLAVLPGILGDIMRQIPIVVSLALFISLLEAFWMLPAHLSYLKVSLSDDSRSQRMRSKFTRVVRIRYMTMLVATLRKPTRALLIAASAPIFAMIVLSMGWIKLNFFATDLYRLFYISIDLPLEAPLERSLGVALDVEEKVLEIVDPEELRSTMSYSGLQITDMEFFFGENLAQVAVSLLPEENGMRPVKEVIEEIKAALGPVYQGADITMLEVLNGPPVSAPITLKVRGDNFEQVQTVVDELLVFIRSNEAYRDIWLDFRPGSPELTVELNGDAIKRAGINPVTVARSLQSYVDGELVTQYQSFGEEVNVRLLAKRDDVGIDTLLQQTIATPSGEAMALEELLNFEYGKGYQNIRHYDFLRAITINSEIDTDITNAVDANAMLLDYWETIKSKYPEITIDATGQLDDIDESLTSMGSLFLLGIGLIYIILGTQFRSYLQPIIILCTIPLAFSGAVFGLLITGNPLSLYTLYGVIALAGISVNTAIVMVSAANARVEAGMSYLHATLYAARRRVVPILITSLTTIAGLFSLAAGFAGKSLIWGPVATSIVGGLFFSTGLMLVAIPTLYLATVKFKYGKER